MADPPKVWSPEQIQALRTAAALDPEPGPERVVQRDGVAVVRVNVPVGGVVFVHLEAQE